MTVRIAAILALLAFTICLLSGGAAGNPFTTTVSRALTAMIATLVIGLVLGEMARKMIDENLKMEEKKLKKNSGPPGPDDR